MNFHAPVETLDGSGAAGTGDAQHGGIARDHKNTTEERTTTGTSAARYLTYASLKKEIVGVKNTQYVLVYDELVLACEGSGREGL